MVRVDENGSAGVMASDHFHHLGERQLRESTAPDLLRRGHAQDSHLAEAIDDCLRDLGIPVDGCRVDMFVAVSTYFGDCLLNDLALLRTQIGIREQERSVEVSEEETLGEAES